MRTTYVATARTIEIANYSDTDGWSVQCRRFMAPLFLAGARGADSSGHRLLLASQIRYPPRRHIKLYLSPLALIVELEAKLKVPRRQGSLDYSKVRHSES